MDTITIDSHIFADMLRNGLSNISVYEKEINKLNVFPVADGDTGTNMRLTVENGISNVVPDGPVGDYLRGVSNGMLLGARGNSGVILSQIFKGIAQSLADNDVVGVADLFAGFENGYKTAYSTVVNPVEGTILTVAREGVENIRASVGAMDSVEDLLDAYHREMQHSLANTPELLSVLKNAGVVDSGAMGYCIIIDGMLKCLNGERIGTGDISDAYSQPSQQINLDYFDGNSTFDDGYCMEFLLQLMSVGDYRSDFDIDEYIAQLKDYGESIVAIRDDMRVKVHIHTKEPAPIITCSQQFGEFLTFKLENMQLQHNEHTDIVGRSSADQPRKFMSVVSVADGDGFATLFGDLGCDVVINGGATMNPPAYDFLNAFDRVNADNIVVLPNNRNAVSAAEQAKSLYKGDASVYVIESCSMIDAYYAIAMDVADREDIDFRITQMQSGIADNHTLAIASATKGYSYSGGEVATGDSIALVDGEIVYSADDMVDTVINGLRHLPDIDEKDVCMIVRGEDTADDMEDVLYDAIGDAFPDIEVSFIYGGQHIYHWLIGLI